MLQSVICSSERSEDPVENIEGLQQKNVSPGDKNKSAYSVLQPSREVTYLEMSTGDKDMPSAGNNFIGKFDLNGLFPLLDEKGIYNDLRKPPELSMPTNEAVHDLKLVLMDEKANFLELNDPSCPLSCPCEASQIEWIQGEEQHLADEDISSMILANMTEMAETFLQDNY